MKANSNYWKYNFKESSRNKILIINTMEIKDIKHKNYNNNNLLLKIKLWMMMMIVTALKLMRVIK